MPRMDCPNCGASVTVQAGKSTRCPDCDERVRLPGTGAKKKRKPIEQPKSKLPMILGVAGGVLMLLIGIVVLVMVLLGGGGAGGGNPFAAEPDEEMEPELTSTNTNFISFRYPTKYPPVDSSTWLVRPEAVEPAPQGLRSTFLIPGTSQGKHDKVLSLLFSEPKAAKATVLHRDSNEQTRWIQLSLTDPAQTKEVQLETEKGSYRPSTDRDDVALSPSGNRLVYGEYGGVSNGLGFTRIRVTESTGKTLELIDHGPYVPGNGTFKEFFGFWFLDEDRFIALTKDKLFCRDIKTKKTLWEHPQKCAGNGVLTAGRGWLLLAVPDGIEAFNTADGKPAGQLKIPEMHKDGTSQLAISPDGTRLGALSDGIRTTKFASWTLADGKQTAEYASSIRSGYSYRGNTGADRVTNKTDPFSWDGTDPYLGMRYTTQLSGLGYHLPMASGVQPDTRRWQLFQPMATDIEEFHKASPGKGDVFLVAHTAPKKPDGTTLWCDETVLRVEAISADGLAAEYRQGVAKRAALNGIRVSKNGTVTAKLEMNYAAVGGASASTMYTLKLIDAEGKELQPIHPPRQGEGRSFELSPTADATPAVQVGRHIGMDLPILGYLLCRDRPPVKFPLPARIRADGTCEIVLPPK